jgi:hypothetical protein
MGDCPKFYEYKILQMRADELRRSKDGMVYAQVKDENGNWKLVKHPLFKDNLAHV